MSENRKVLLVSETSYAYERALLRGIARYSSIHGHWVFYQQRMYYYRLKENPARRTHEQKNIKVDGIIAHVFNKKDLKRLMAAGVPIIVDPGNYLHKSRIKEFSLIPNFACDSEAIGKMAAEHLLNCGLHDFAYCGFSGILDYDERRKSFVKRITKSGFTTKFCDLPRLVSRSHSLGEENFVASWLMSLPKPIGLMACNDDCAQIVNEAAKIAGLRVPDDVAIIGVTNDDLICELSKPPLSSIALDTETAGYDAAALLDELMAGRKKMDGQTINIRPTHVAVRQSTDVLSVENRDVAQAIRFIRQHVGKPIQVSDVANATAISEWTLQKQFQKILGRTILEEIKRIRVEQIRRLLVETDMSISRIAMELGYLSVDHIARYFHSVKGIGPLAYRKKYHRKSL
jgi:LacI family transcriptional regulator